MNNNLRYQILKMTFIQILKELEQKLKGSNSYPMTTRSVKILLNMRIQQNDINIIFDAINNDTFHNNDPLSLRNLWNEKRLISNLRF
jgi:hypothetical protein